MKQHATVSFILVDNASTLRQSATKERRSSCVVGARNALRRPKKTDARSFFAFRNVYFILFFPFSPPTLRVSSVRTNRAEICTRTSMQVAIGLFPIDSVRGEFLLFSLLFFSHCFISHSRTVFVLFISCSRPCCTLPSSSFLFISLSFALLHTFSLSLSFFYSSSPSYSRVPLFRLFLLSCLSAFCNLDTDEIKETLY